MRRLSNIFFVIACIVQIVSNTLLIVLSNVFLKDETYLKFESIFTAIWGYLFLIVGFIVRKNSEDSRPVLAGIFTMICLGAFGIPSGILLFVAARDERVSEIRSIPVVNRYENQFMLSLKENGIPKKMAGYSFRHSSYVARYKKGNSSKEEYEAAESALRETVLQHLDELIELRNKLNENLNSQNMAISDYNHFLNEIDGEIERVNVYLDETNSSENE